MTTEQMDTSSTPPQVSDRMRELVEQFQLAVETPDTGEVTLVAYIKARDALLREIAALEAKTTWQPIETAPNGYTIEEGFHHVLFLGTSRSGAFRSPVVVSGYMDSERKPVQFYSYKLNITHWMPLLEAPHV